MLKRIKLAMLSVMAFGLLVVPALVPATVGAEAAQIKENLCQGSSLKFGTSDQSSCKNGSANETSLNDLIAKIVNIISILVAIVAVIMIIWGGFKYITSGGDSGNVTGAKNTILYAIIGLVVVGLAQFVVKFVLNQTSAIG